MTANDDRLEKDRERRQSDPEYRAWRYNNDLNHVEAIYEFVDREVAEAVAARDAEIRQAADDPAVVEAVVDEIRTLLDGHGEQADVEVEQAANGAITATLTALIGPRPQGENDEDSR